MSAALLLGVGLAGGLGAVARVLAEAAVARRAAHGFPWGILAVNLSGALALGVLSGAVDDADGAGYRLAAVGFAGAFTTFSTWMVDSRRLAEEGRRGAAAANLLASLAAGLVAVWLGRELGRML